MKGRVLVIGGFDPTGWAGVLADAAVMRDRGMEVHAALSALTVQDLERVYSVEVLGPGLVEGQCRAVFSLGEVSGVKIGMLGSREAALAVAGLLERQRPSVVVLDPVLASTSGRALLDEGGSCVLRERLIGLATVVTPNLHEASALTGLEVADRRGMERAARVLVEGLGAGAALVKGGHLGAEPVDLLYDGAVFREFGGRRLRGPRGLFHGTGCMLASGITAGLVEGLSLEDSVRAARAGLLERIERRRALL